MAKRIFLILLLWPFAIQAQEIITIAGTGTCGHDTGVPALSAEVCDPGGGVFDKYGNYYFADCENANTIRKIDTSGIITTVAGNGMGTFGGDNGPATLASLNLPGAVILDTSGNLYIADEGNARIRKVNAVTGIITTIAGNGQGGYEGDGGLATAAEIWDPQDICFDKFGNLYIADIFNYVVRKVDPAGIITTFAGNDTVGFSGDGGPATAAKLDAPEGLAADDTGNIYIADIGSLSSRVRKVNLAGIITTVAGNGAGNYNGDNVPATNAQINGNRLCFDSLNNLFISDKYNNRVYKITTDGILHNIAGNEVAGDSGDNGPATAASLYAPVGVALDHCGNLYIPTVGQATVTGSGKRIRKVIFDSTCNYNSDTTHTDTTNAVQNVQAGSFNVYPNPATTAITIETSMSLTNDGIVLYNMVGQIVLRQSISSQKTILDIESLPNGVYMLEVTDSYGQRYTKKVLKE